MALHDENQIAEESISRNNAEHDANPFRHFVVSIRIMVCFEDGGPSDLAHRLQVAGIHALIAVSKSVAVVDGLLKLIDHHTLEDIGLVVDVVKDV